MTKRALALKYPRGGVSRRLAYRDTQRPFTTPWAWNVWGEGQVENRERGGTRPGLEKFNANRFHTGAGTIAGVYSARFLDAAGAHQNHIYVITDGVLSVIEDGVVTTLTSVLLWEDGEEILWEDGETIVFDSTVSASSPGDEASGFSMAMLDNLLYIADSALKGYDPKTGIVETIVASSGTVPTSQPIVAAYRARILLGGENHIWYASRMGDTADWSFADEMTDVARAVAGQGAVAGGLSGVLKAIIPHLDKYVVMGTTSSIYLYTGDLSTGTRSIISDTIGIMARKAWAMSPEGLLAFLSKDGAYLWPIGSEEHPTRFSEERVPEELREIDPDTTTISMAYDAKYRGFHLYLTPVNGDGTHWWLDVESKAIWPMILQAGHQPDAIASHYTEDSLPVVILGCRDGYLRNYSSGATDDDGEDIENHVILGPFRMAGNDVLDAMLVELQGSISGDVTWRVFTGKSAEIVADEAVAAMNAIVSGILPAEVKAEGSWSGGSNTNSRPRTRGPWCAILLSATGQWAFESVVVTTKKLGRVRN
jgi:hypothetical protein